MKKYGATPDFTNKDTAKSAAADFQAMADVAPSAIKADMQTEANAMKQVAAGNADALQADQQKIETAGTNLEKYLKDTCGLTTPTTT